MKTCIQIHPADNVAVALVPLSSGTAITPDTCEGLTAPSLTLTEDIPAGHKFAPLPVKSGDPVIKYGHPIGYSSCTVSTGSWVHTHNLKTGLEGQHSYTWQPEKFSRERSPRSEASQDPAVGQTAAALNRSDFFDGYLRPDGQAGIRNEIWILPTVGCVSRLPGKSPKNPGTFWGDPWKPSRLSPILTAVPSLAKTRKPPGGSWRIWRCIPTPAVFCWWGWAVKTPESRYCSPALAISTNGGSVFSSARTVKMRWRRVCVWWRNWPGMPKPSIAPR